MTSSMLVHCASITKSYPGVNALDSVDLTLSSGETVVLVGPNGSGKSTLISILIGRSRPDDGTVTISADETGRRVFSVQYQGASLPSRMTIREAVTFWASAWNCPENAYLASLEQVGLTEDQWRRPASKLSGGERRKALVALTAASPAPVVVLDEPTVGLDLDAKAALAELIRHKQAEGTAILVCTHELDFAQTIGDRFDFLIGGRLRRSVAADEVLRKESNKIAELVFKTAPGRQRAMRKLRAGLEGSVVTTTDRGGYPAVEVEVCDEMDFFEHLVSVPGLRPDLISVELRGESLATVYEGLTNEAMLQP